MISQNLGVPKQLFCPPQRFVRGFVACLLICIGDEFLVTSLYFFRLAAKSEVKLFRIVMFLGAEHFIPDIPTSFVKLLVKFLELETVRDVIPLG